MIKMGGKLWKIIKILSKMSITQYSKPIFNKMEIISSAMLSAGKEISFQLRASNLDSHG